MQNQANLIVGCIYKHPHMDNNVFNETYISPLLQKLSKEASKNIFLLGDFNIDLLKFETCPSACSFLDNLASNFLLPQILLPTRISPHSKTLIDNIFCNIPSYLTNTISANLSATFSDHLPQILILSNFYPSIPKKCVKNLIRDW